MSLTLYGSPNSGSAAIEMALRAAALEYTLVRASSWEPESKYGELLHVNPLGQIPTLRLEDGTVLSESAAILIHLALICPAAELLPLALSARAVALRGLVFIAANCYCAVSVSDYPERWTTALADEVIEQVRVAAKAQLHHAWEVFADEFGANAEFQGAMPGGLAFLAVVVSQWSGTREHLREHRPDFLQSLQQLEDHERLRPVLQEHRAR